MKALGQQILASPSHCPGPRFLFCLVGWTGAKGQCCVSPLQGQGMCAVPQLSPELLSCSAEGGEVSVPCRTCPWQNEDGHAGTWFCPYLVPPQSLGCWGGQGLPKGTAGRGSQLAEAEMSSWYTHSTGNRRVCTGSRQDLALLWAPALQS